MDQQYRRHPARRQQDRQIYDQAAAAEGLKEETTEAVINVQVVGELGEQPLLRGEQGQLW